MKAFTLPRKIQTPSRLFCSVFQSARCLIGTVRLLFSDYFVQYRFQRKTNHTIMMGRLRNIFLSVRLLDIRPKYRCRHSYYFQLSIGTLLISNGTLINFLIIWPPWHNYFVQCILTFPLRNKLCKRNIFQSDRLSLPYQMQLPGRLFRSVFLSTRCLSCTARLLYF